MTSKSAAVPDPPADRGARIGAVYSICATKKLLDRVKRKPEPAVDAGSMLGNWYATLIAWRPQLVLLVNEHTLFPVVMPLAPAATLAERFPAHLGSALLDAGAPTEFVDAESAAMGEGSFAKTDSRSVVGVMNDFVRLAGAWRDRGDEGDLAGLSGWLAEVPCSPLYESHGSPDRELLALVDRWKAGELVPRPRLTLVKPLEEQPVAASAAKLVADPWRIVNRRTPNQLSKRDLEDALERMYERDPEGAHRAEQDFDSMSGGEGPWMVRQWNLQEWLWDQLTTKVLTYEPDYKTLAAAALAELFDELGLDRYAAICRSEATAEVHAAFGRSNRAGYSAMRKALAASGIEPTDTDTFAWGSVMDTAEYEALAEVQLVLEDAIQSGRLQPGTRGWKKTKAKIIDEALDGNHLYQLGQSYRTAVLTERIAAWVDEPDGRSRELGRRRATIANRLLSPISPPADVAEAMRPLMWLLSVFGKQQALTQAGYLNRAFVQQVSATRPWSDAHGADRVANAETDDVGLHQLRGLLQACGALRKRGQILERTRLGARMADDAELAWAQVVAHFGERQWGRFVTETAGLMLLGADRGLSADDLMAEVAETAGEMGWRIDRTEPPDQGAASRAFRGFALEVLGLTVEEGDWGSRTLALTPAGEVTVLAMLRHTAAGPRGHS
ncbi:MAG: hypothetical protein R2770_19060 [Acidimicrobiales bacterium]